MKNEIMYPCPLCENEMTVKPDTTGVMVICENECLPTCHENVFGHGKTAKEAWTVSKEKFRVSK